MGCSPARPSRPPSAPDSSAWRGSCWSRLFEPDRLGGPPPPRLSAPSIEASTGPDGPRRDGGWRRPSRRGEPEETPFDAPRHLDLGGEFRDGGQAVDPGGEGWARE